MSEFDYSDNPEAYDRAMAKILDEDSDELGEQDYRLLTEEEKKEVAGMVEMNDIIGQQAGGLAGMEDLTSTESYLEASDD
jgi:hypothetical protein